MGKNKRMIEGQLNLFEMFLVSDVTDEATEAVTKSEKLKGGAFTECISCWCYDCKHNTINEGVPRELCGQQMPCPACDFCIENQKAEICIIGSAKEGCQVRAAEEGMIEE